MNISVKFFRDALSDAAGAIGTDSPIVGAALGVGQAVAGAIKAHKDRKAVNGLIGQLQPIQTPDQIGQILSLSEGNAQGDLQTQDYETNQLNNNFAESLGSATKLGADPNDLSSLFQQNINGVLAIGEQTHQSRTAAFSSLIGALQNTADYNVAQQISKNDIIKNKLQAYNVNLAADNTNVGNGINTTLGSLSSAALANLYKPKNTNTSSGNFADQLNKYLLSNSVNNQLSGSVTDADSRLSSLPNSNTINTA